jgi:hypothetical protein
MLAGKVRVGFQLNQGLAVHVGYQALFLNNVALAPDQVGATGNLDVIGPATVPMTLQTNSFFMHGLSLGVTLNF